MATIRKVIYLESEDDGPDKTKAKTGVTVHDVVRAHVFKVHTLLT